MVLDARGSLVGLWTALAVVAIRVMRADAYGCVRQRGTCACQTDVAGGFKLDLSRLAGQEQPRFRATGWERVCALPLRCSTACSLISCTLFLPLPVPVRMETITLSSCAHSACGSSTRAYLSRAASPAASPMLPSALRHCSLCRLSY